jgi:MFS family permease
MVELLLLFLVFLGEAGLAQIIYLARVFIDKPVLVFFLLYILQLVFATFQAGISDHYCRRKSLLFALVAILLGQGFFFAAFEWGLWPLVASIMLYGITGNITPIARAALMDTELKKDFRMSVGLSTIAIALGWISMMIAAYFLPPAAVAWIVTVLAVLGMFVVLFYFKDPRDLKGTERFTLTNEAKRIYQLIKHKWFFYGLAGYFIAEVAFYQIFCFDEGNLANPDVRYVITTWVIGYCIGAVVQIFGIKDEKFGILSGAYISLVSIALLIIFNIFNIEKSFIVTIFNFMFAFGFGFFVPCLFAFASKRFNPNLQGKMYGLIDATDALGILCGVGMVLATGKDGLTFLVITSGVLVVAAYWMFRSAIRHAGRA